MASRKRELTCKETGKRCFDEHYLALRHAERVATRMKEDIGNLNVYKCEHCLYLHIGHENTTLKPKSLRAELYCTFANEIAAAKMRS